MQSIYIFLNGYNVIMIMSLTETNNAYIAINIGSHSIVSNPVRTSILNSAQGDRSELFQVMTKDDILFGSHILSYQDIA